MGAGQQLFAVFQPTPSSRRVTAIPVPSALVQRISTNTLLAEGDGSLFLHLHPVPEFQPTPSSRRVTPLPPVPVIFGHAFQPTPSSRRVTYRLKRPPKWR